MPTYSYTCAACGHHFDEMQSIKAKPLSRCPRCGGETLQREISGGSGFLLRGDGWPSKELRIHNSPELRTQREVYEQSYGGVDVSAARAKIQRAGGT